MSSTVVAVVVLTAAAVAASMLARGSLEGGIFWAAMATLLLLGLVLSGPKGAD